MNTIDNSFFEEYKHLNKLLTEMGYDDGINEYISLLESKGLTCDKDYKQLKRCRYLRNQLAHSIVDKQCSQDDLDYITDFYNRVYAVRDPLSTEQIQKSPINKNKYSHYPPVGNPHKKHTYVLEILFFLLLLSATITVILCIFIETR